MNIKNIFSLGFLIVITLFLVSCGSSSSGGGSNITGNFIDDPVAGLAYRCSSGVNGETSADGEFTCHQGDDITFYLGSNPIGPVPAINSLITPYSFFPGDETAAVNLARLLQSVDADGDPDNGVIAANDDLFNLLPANMDFSSPSFTTEVENALGITLVSAQQAQQALNESIVLFGSVFYPDISRVPVADAGGNQNVIAGSTVVINASGSFTPTGSELIYGWMLISKPAGSLAALASWDAVSTTFVADVAGDYVIKLLVIANSFTSTDDIIITAGNNLALPVAPGGITATAGDALVMLFWNGVTGADSYRFYWNTTGGVTTSDRYVNAGSNFGIQTGHMNLSNGTTYYYRVAATNSSGEGGLSVEVSATPITTVIDVPAVPQGVVATAGDTAVALSWNTVSAADNYTVYWNTSGGVTTSDSQLNAAANTQINHTGLSNDTTYYYRVAATNSSGEGGLSAEVSATPDTTVITVPAAPQGVTATAGDTAVALSWNMTAGANNYTVYWNTGGGVTTSDSQLSAAANTQINHTGLSNDTTYYYRVSASNSSGEGVLSSEVSATPAVPSNEVPAAPQSFQVSAGDAQIAFSWAAATGASSYAVYWTDTGVFSDVNSINVGNTTQYTLTGLTNGSRYFCRVYAINAIGQTSSDVVFTTPEIPVPLVFQAIAGDGQTELSWDAVGTQAYSYKVYWSTSSNVSTLDNSIDAGTSTQVLHTGLSSGATHYYRVSATGAAGEGELSSRISSAQPTTWQWVNPEPQGNSIEALVWGNNQFVAVGPAGSVLTSPDGLNWTIQSAGTASDLSDIAWNGSIFVAVGEGAIITSADGITWSAQSSGSIYSAVYDITWNGSLFVAVGYNTILTSPDGVAWTRRTITSSGWLNHVTWGGSQFVIYEYPGNILTSADGISWSKYTDVVSNVSGIAWDGGRFVAASSNSIYTSSDGIAWVNIVVTDFNLATGSLIWDGSRFVGTGQTGWILTSPDGLSWTTQISNTTERLATIVWNGSQYVVGGSAGTILNSPDAVNWTQRLPITSVTTESLNDVVWNGSQFVAVGRTGTIVTSPDGDTWISQNSGVTSLSLESIIWNGSQYMVVGTDFLTSPDGVNWTTRNAGMSASSVVWDGSQYVAVGGYKEMATSPDGINWTIHTIDSTVGFNAVVWNGTIFVAVGGYGTGYNIMTSPDGITWTVNANLFGRLDDVIWANNQFVAAGAMGRTITSPDGLTWTSHYEIDSSGYLINLEWDGTQYVLSSAEGHIYTSADGVNWARQNTGSGGWIDAITWDDTGKAVAVGLFGAILTNTSW